MTYLDANILYGWAMSQYLPMGNFKWLTNEQINTFDVMKVDNADKGYILKVDLNYPQDSQLQKNRR